MAAIHRRSVELGLDEMSEDEIDAEIQATRLENDFGLARGAIVVQSADEGYVARCETTGDSAAAAGALDAVRALGDQLAASRP